MTRPVRLAVTGHQKREGADWDWVAEELRRILADRPVERGFSCLAVGSDQIFADVALSLEIPVTAVIPITDYERCFDGDGLQRYRRLLARCDRLELRSSASEEQAFLDAGRIVADSADELIAIWDGKPAQGLGGSADVVRHCVDRGMPVLHLNPISRDIREIYPNIPLEGEALS
ncbi:MAG: hypothetical protein DI565_02660 [Ancylobacter novellus]|uniref:DUF1273 domain-containing protein n=1 Tax=Ancylobacter novellus TaxID=921 RepID=A0A2W5KX18_ANCNO|nr:MAG: hypothetical protein DI565_02660 [Ancylobacter novellus]